MTLRVAFRAAARRELVEAAGWYELQRAGLGSAFLGEIDRCLASVAEHPSLYATVRGDVRRVVTRRFPYGLYYRIRADRIVVVAVLHGSRDPRVWQRRR